MISSIINYGYTCMTNSKIHAMQVNRSIKDTNTSLINVYDTKTWLCNTNCMYVNKTKSV